ncbi:MAG: AMP-binding protein [Pseudonocardiaceae bacterium]
MPFRSPFPDVEIPDVSLPDLLFGDVAGKADRPALVDGVSGQTITYGQLSVLVDQVAGALAARGIGKGDVVAVFAPNTPYYAVAFHGILRAGATATTVNALYTPDELAAQLRDSQAKLMFTVSPFLERAQAAAAVEGVRVTETVVLDGAAGHPSLADLLAQDGAPPEISIDPARDLAVLPYSSGTTGNAKGVMLTHRNLVANIMQCEALFAVPEGTRLLAVLPFFHIYGMTVLMNHGLHRGLTVITLPRFDLETFLGSIQEHRVNRVYIVPPVAVALAKHPMIDSYDLSCIDVVFSGAAALDADLAAAVAARIGCEVKQGYGMTEMSPVSHAMPDGRTGIPLGSVGPTIPNMECKIVDPETGEEVGVGVPGELWCKGPNVMVGYLDNPAATAQTLDSDGFLHTGDIASVDADGNVTIVDRVKELIKYKGYQVPPAELEALLLTHPQIADAAVIGVRDAEGEEVPKAFVVRQAGGEGLTDDDVIAFVAQRVAPYKKVRAVQFVEAIPKSASGKILRKDLRAVEPAAT